jgi:hypothetical protein
VKIDLDNQEIIEKEEEQKDEDLSEEVSILKLTKN